MKRIILILGLILFILPSTAQTVSIGDIITNVGAKGDKGDAGIGGGSESPFIKAVTTQAELIAALDGKKELSIQADFALTSDVTIPDGAILSDGGGVIDVNGYNVTFVNNSFRSDYTRTFINLGQNGVINDASTFSNGNINPTWFGLVADGVVGDTDTVQSGTDNRNVFLQAQKIYNKTGGAAKLTSGNYAYSVIGSRATIGWTPTNLYIEDKASFEMIGDVKLIVLPNALQGYDAFSMYKGRNTYLKGGVIIGDRVNHAWGSDDVSDSPGCHGVIVDYDSKYSKVETSITDFPGDNLYCVGGGSVLFSTANGTEIQETDFYVINDGNPLAVIEENGDVTASTTWAYTKLYDITSTSAISEEIMFVGSHAYAGETGFESNSMMVAYYDEVGTFVARTGLVEYYNKIPTNPNYKQFRLIARIPATWSDYLSSVIIDKAPEFMTLAPPLISNGVRQGVSNVSARSILENTRFLNNGKRFESSISGTPAYIIDIEDGYQRRRDIEIRGCTFTNGKLGVIILKGTKSARIHDNTFNYETDPDYQGNDITLTNGHETQFFNNTVKGKVLALGRQDRVYDNTFWDCIIGTADEGTIVEDNTFYNSGVGQTTTPYSPAVYTNSIYNFGVP